MRGTVSCERRPPPPFDGFDSREVFFLVSTGIVGQFFFTLFYRRTTARLSPEMLSAAAMTTLALFPVALILVHDFSALAAVLIINGAAMSAWAIAQQCEIHRDCPASITPGCNALLTTVALLGTVGGGAVGSSMFFAMPNQPRVFELLFLVAALARLIGIGIFSAARVAIDRARSAQALCGL
jgi:hypothetical protein